MNSFLKFHHMLNNQRYTMYLRPEQSMMFDVREPGDDENDTRQEVFTAKEDSVLLTITTTLQDGYDRITTQHELRCTKENLATLHLLYGAFPLWTPVSSTQHVISTRTQGCQG